MTHEAACSCGQLRVDADGDPIRVSVCHCLACQRRTGSAFGVQARFAEENVRFEGRSKEYVRMSDDGAPRTFHFCPECGSTVYYRLGGVPGAVAIPVGGFANPSFAAPWISIYQSRQHPWVTLPEEMEHFD
jgi:hypothetical protein